MNNINFNEVIKLLKNRNFNNPELLNKLNMHRDIYKNIFIKSLKKEKAKYDFETNFNYLLSGEKNISRVKPKLFLNKDFALYCLKRNGELIIYFDELYNDIDIILEAVKQSGFDALFSNDIINVYDDLLRELYGSNQKIIKIIVNNSNFKQKNEIKKWVKTKDKYLLDYIDNNNNYKT